MVIAGGKTVEIESEKQLLGDEEFEKRVLTEKEIATISWDILDLMAIDKEKATLIISKLLYQNDVSFESALKIFEGQVHKSTKNTLERTYTQMLTEEEALDDTRISDLFILEGFNEAEATKIEREILKSIQAPRHYGMMISSLGTNKLVVMDPRRKVTFLEYIKQINGRDVSTEEIVIKASLKELTVYDNPVAQETRQFKSVWESHLSPGRPIVYGPDSAGEIAAMLNESSYSLVKNKTEDVVKSVFAMMIEQGKATMKTEIDTPGFYYNENKGTIDVIKYDLPQEVTKEELVRGLSTLEDFAEYFQSRKTALATVFKWGLISPFGFAIKQLGGWIKWPFLYGNGGTGKSTLGKMVLYIWGEPDNNTNNVGGGGFDNEARIGDRLKQFTFPLVVDEPGSLFEKKGPSEMIKTAVEHTTSRGKYVGRRYRTIPAYSSVVFTSNHKYPDDDAFDRRFYKILFPRSERKSREERAEFDNKFQMNNTKNCKLHDLKAIGNYFAIEIVNNPSLLELDWQELTNTLLVRLYGEVGMEMPSWLLKWAPVETMGDLDDIHMEDIRGFFQEAINQAFGQIQILDEEMRTSKKYDNAVEVKSTDDFKHRVWVVLNERKIPWLLQGSDNMVYITHGLIRALKKKECINESLPSIADLLGWRYSKGAIKSAGFSGAHLRVHRSVFTEFVFPACGDGDHCDGN